jgi:carboxylate-amine ligase
VFRNVPIAGGLRPYADSVETLVELQFARHYGWLEAMDQARVDRALFLNTGGDLLESAWNPVRLNALGTVEIRSIDSNYPDLVVALMTLVDCVATRVREEFWTVKPSSLAFFFRENANELLVPEFEFLNNILLYAAVTTGISHPYVKEYIESILEFAFVGNEGNPNLNYLRIRLNSNQTTESEILEELPVVDQVPETVGLRFVRQCCDRLEEKVSLLSQQYLVVTPNPVPGAVRV